MAINFTKLCLSVFALIFFAGESFAQKQEAENATLTNGATKVACTTCSGGFYVAQNAGNLAFNVDFAETGFYNLYITAAAPGGEKTNIISIDGNSADFVLEQNNQYAKFKIVNSYKLTAGQHKIEIKNSWGYMNIDFIELEKINAQDRFNLDQTLVTPNPLPEAAALYNFLLDNYGDKIISGAMTLNSTADSPWITWLKTNTGKEPALLGFDLLHSGQGYSWYDDKQPIKDAKAWYERNGIPTILWHWRDPSNQTDEFYTKNESHPAGTDFDITKISDVNSAEYKAMIADIDFVAGLLKELQNNNVPVIWRPLHEAAGGWFWWGAQGAAPLKQLYQVMFDRMVNYHGLRNLIWVWTREPNDEAWYPGDNYVDIVGRDIYKTGDHSSHAIEFNNLNTLYGGKKMITLSEVGSFPDPDNLVNDGAGWAWFMPWYNEYTYEGQYNTLDLWKKAMAHEYVITLDEMPNLKTYVRQETGTTGLFDKFVQQQSFKAYPTFISDKLIIEGDKKIETIAVYNLIGAHIKSQKGTGKKITVPFAGLQKGYYLVVINGTETIKVWKE